jgi:putative ABC transport system permease protein
VNHFLFELRTAARRLYKDPGFSVVAALMLALGLGANSAIFSVAYRTILRPLPFPDADRLALLKLTSIWEGTRQTSDWSYPFIQDLRARSRSFNDLAAFQSLDLSLTGDDRPERISAEVASPRYFAILGTVPIRGRAFLPGESVDAPGEHAVALIGYDLWQRRFGGDPGLIGRTIHLDTTALTVVGILPPGFRGLSGEAEVWAPLAMAPVLYHEHALDAPWNLWLQVVGRLAPGVSLESTGRELAALGANIAAAHPLPVKGDFQWSGAATALPEARTTPGLALAVLILELAVGLVLLIVCANLANLMLVRTDVRSRDLAVKAALGYRPWALARETLIECSLLSATAGLVGLLIAAEGPAILARLRPLMPSQDGLPLAFLGSAVGGFDLQATVVCFNFGLSALVLPIFGLAPALVASRTNLSATLAQLRSGGCGSRPAWWRHGGRKALVVLQIALSLALLAGAGLLLASLHRLLKVDTGFDPDRTLTFRVEPPRSRYPSGAPSVRLLHRMLDRLSALPGVDAVSVDKCSPLGANCPSTVLTHLDGRTNATLAEAPRLGMHHVSPDYFRLLRVPVLEGRAFDRGDAQGTPPVVVLNRAAEHALFGTHKALGRRIALASALFRDPAETAEVVGVVGNVHYGPPTAPVEPAAYISSLQYTFASTMFFLRTGGDPAALTQAVRKAVREVDPDLPIFDVRTLSDRIDDAYSQSLTGTTLLAIFAVIALALAALGVYGVVSYSVALRRRELAVRLALGARRRELRNMVLRSALKITAIGVVLGLGGALLLSRLLSRLLFGVSATDYITFGLAALVLTATSLVAAWLPAQRAARLNPIEILK